MEPILGETIHLDFTITDDTGAASDADSTPVVTVWEDATDTAILTPTVTKRTGPTGHYRVPVACTTGNGFEVGKSYNVKVNATVGSVATHAIILRFPLREHNADTLKADLTTLLANSVTLDAGTVSASPSPTTTTFTATGSNLNAVTGTYNGMKMYFTSGTYAGSWRQITTHTVSGSDHAFVIEALPSAPASGVTFVLI